MEFNEKDIETVYAALNLAIKFEEDFLSCLCPNGQQPTAESDLEAVRSVKSNIRRFMKLRKKISQD
jgi:hypothetical protein